MCDKKKCSLIGLTMGILMSVMVIVFFLMYTTFTSLFSSLDLSHIYAYQITRLKMVNIYVNIIRFCFYASLLVAGIYVIKSLTMYRKNHRKIYLTTTIIGLVTLTSLILCLNFMVTLHNLGLFTHDLNTTQISELRVKYDYIVSLITQSSGFASLLSRAKLFVISGLIGFSNLALHAIYLLESAHHVVLESDDLKLSMTRIEKLLKQDEKIKIDHHLIVDQYGDLNIVDEKASSCAQVITSLYQSVEDDYTLSKEAASCLYLGIVGDSNRFLYRNTDERTFQAASTLLKHGVDIEALYKRLYLRPERDLQVTKFILNNYQVENKVAYYILKDEDLQTLQISREEGSNYVNTLANIEEFAIWVAVTENTKDHNVRVSIRSREVPINTIASAFHGGGHALASGATLSSFEELPALIKALGEAAASYQKDE